MRVPKAQEEGEQRLVHSASLLQPVAVCCAVPHAQPSEELFEFNREQAKKYFSDHPGQWPSCPPAAFRRAPGGKF